MSLVCVSSVNSSVAGWKKIGRKWRDYKSISLIIKNEIYIVLNLALPVFRLWWKETDQCCRGFKKGGKNVKQLVTDWFIITKLYHHALKMHHPIDIWYSWYWWSWQEPLEFQRIFVRYAASISQKLVFYIITC